MSKKKRTQPNVQTTNREDAYRRLVRSHLKSERITVQETDLCIYAQQASGKIAKEAVIQLRSYIQNYIQRFPDFAATLNPYPEDPLAPPIVQEMIQAASKAGVGPMAAVAGAVAQRVGLSLLNHSSEVIVENGGDIFVAAERPLTVGVFAGQSPLNLKVGLLVRPEWGIQGVCTSSGTIGHSLSFGRADAVVVLSPTCALADAAATAVGNRVTSAVDIEEAIEWAKTVEGVQGVLIIVGDKIGAWGKIEMIPL